VSARQFALAVIGIVAAVGFIVLIILSITSHAYATPCITADYDPAVSYYEVELNGIVYEIQKLDELLKADAAELPDGIYDVAVTAVGENDRPPPVYFTLFKQSDKNKCYYSMTPEPGYEQFFSEPLVMVINVKAGKAVGN